MKIAFLTTEFAMGEESCGGLGNYLLKIATALKRAGHEPLVITLSLQSGMALVHGVPVYNVAVKWRWNALPFARFISVKSLEILFNRLVISFALCRELRRLRRLGYVEIVQYPSLGALALFAPYNIPGVIRVSSIVGLWSQMNRESNLRYRYEMCDDYLERLAMRRFKFIFGPSSTIAAQVSRKNNKEVAVIRTPSDLSLQNYCPQVYEDLLRGKSYILFVGTVAYYKGAKLLADVIPSILAGHRDLFVVFAGPDRSFRSEPMMSYVWRSAGVERGRVLYLGSLPHNLLMPIVEHALGVVLPSRVDNLPNAMIESMAMGKVVIGTRGSSFDELLQDGVNGYLIDRDDERALQSKLEQLLSLSSEDRVRMGARARQSMTELAPETIVAEHLEFYAKAVAAHEAGD